MDLNSDARDDYARSVISDMAPHLDKDQLRLLENALYTNMSGIAMKYVCKAVATTMDTNASILKYFIVAKKVQGLSEQTLRYYFCTICKFLAAVNKRVQDVITADIQIYLAEIMNRTSKRNADNYRRVLSSFFNWCEVEEIIPRSPTKKIKKIKSPKYVRQPFTAEEVELMRQSCEDLRNRCILELLLSTACRVSEIAMLNKRDVDLVTGEAKVMGKGAKERMVYLNPVAKLYLKQYLGTRDDDNEALFVSEFKPHKRLQRSGVEIIIRRLGGVVGVKAFPHKLRHTAATMALKRGMPIEQVQKMLGHEKIDTTLIYAKTICEDVKYAHSKYC